jgi:Periplasmic copper-binding protein (NosD)
MSRRRRRLLPARTAVLAFALLAVFVAPAAASLRAAADAVACGQVISADTTLTADLTCAGDALVLQGGATLDLGGHAVRGSGSGTGIFVARVGGVDLANTVRNGTVTGFGTGVYVDVALTSIQGLAVSQNAQRGIYVDPLHVTHNVTIAGNTITGNRYGIQFGGGAGYTSQVVDNHVVANTADGILALYGTDNTVFQRNDVSDNGGSGMSISDSFVSIVDNTLDRNHADGLRAENTSLPADVSRWRIGGNSANGNGGHGLNAVTAGLTDLGGNQAARNAVEPQCVNLACKPASTGLVASYSFNAGSGSSVADGPHERHDARGVGQAEHGEGHVAHRDVQAAFRGDGLRALRARRHGSRRAGVDRLRTQRQRVERAAAERVDAPRDDLRRHDAPALRQRLARLVDRRRRLDGGDDRRPPDRRQLRLEGVLQGRDRRGPHLQTRAFRG